MGSRFKLEKKILSLKILLKTYLYERITPSIQTILRSVNLELASNSSKLSKHQEKILDFGKWIPIYWKIINFHNFHDVLISFFLTNFRFFFLLKLKLYWLIRKVHRHTGIAFLLATLIRIQRAFMLQIRSEGTIMLRNWILNSVNNFLKWFNLYPNLGVYLITLIFVSINYIFKSQGVV